MIIMDAGGVPQIKLLAFPKRGGFGQFGTLFVCRQGRKRWNRGLDASPLIPDGGKNLHAEN